VDDIKIGNKLIGEGHPTLIIAEIGINYDSDIKKAHQLIDLAADAGSDVIKFQTFTASGHLSRKKSKKQWELMKKHELPYEEHAELKKHVEERGCVFMSTPSDRDDVDFLKKLGVAAFKVGSDDTVNYPFLSYIAEKKQPLIVSTGLCTMEEVKEAVEMIRSTGNKDLIILQCTTSYPADVQYANLRAMVSMRDSLNVLVGYSDHTIGTAAAVAAVALGAVIVEKHFTYDKKAHGPDHCLSADPDELKSMISAIREVEKALGSSIKEPSEIEKERIISFRKSVVAACDIAKGAAIKEDMVTAKRPGSGIPAKDIGSVIGKTARRAIVQDELITPEDI